MAEFGLIIAKGAQNVDRLKEQLDRLPIVARTSIDIFFDQLADTDKRIEQLAGEIKETHEQNETSQRLATIPGVGMLSATVIATTTPDVSNFGPQETMRLGSVSPPNRIRPAASRRSALSRRWETAISDDCCISAPWRRSWSDGGAGWDRTGCRIS